MKRLLALLFLCVVAVEGRAASTILAVTPTDAIEDKRILLSNSQAARTWSASLGTNWTKLRVAIRLTMTNNAANITGTPKFAVGICAGTNNVFQHALCSNWVGIVTSEATWTYSASNSTNYSGLDMVAATKVGATITNFASVGTSLCIGANPAFTNRSVMFVDIVKGVGTNFTVQPFHHNTTTASDVTYNTFLEQAESAAPVISGHAFPTAAGVPVNESVNGYLDTVNVAWGTTVPAIHICDVYVVKLQ